MATISEQKIQLRKHFLEKRHDIAKKTAKSRRIIQKLLETIEFKECASLLLYLATEDEVGTNSLIKSALNLGKSIYIPSVSEHKVSLLTENTKLKKSVTGIVEPALPDHDLPLNIDLAVIPGLAFDLNGNRLGHGSGWYDKILAKINIKHKVGLSFAELLTDNLPHEKHDQKVTLVITEKTILRPKF